MREFPKIRKTITWGGAIVAVLAAAAWSLSTRWDGVAQIGAWDVECGAGSVWIKKQPRPYPLSRVRFGYIAHAWTLMDGSWLPQVVGPRKSSNGLWWARVRVPYWVLIMLAAAASGIAWRLDLLAARRRSAHTCAKCGYSRAGLSAATRCPECGAMLVVSKSEPKLEQPTSSPL